MKVWSFCTIVAAVSLLLLVALTLIAHAQAPSKPATTGSGFPDVTVGTLAVVLAPANPQSISVTCTNNDAVNAVRIGAGYTPTPTLGLRVGPGSVYVNWGQQAVRAVSESGAPVVVSCERATP